MADAASKCFCGNPCKPGRGSRSTGDESEWESTLYCRRACAVADALRALTARQTVAGEASFRVELTDEQLGHFTHYRRMFKARGVDHDDKRTRFRRKDDDALPSYNSTMSLSFSTSSPPSSPTSTKTTSLQYLASKPLPRLPPSEPTTLGNLLLRNLSNRHPPTNIIHTRNSSLSSFADSTRFTNNSASTRATSIASDCPSSGGGSHGQHPNSHSRNASSATRLEELLEEDEGPTVVVSSEVRQTPPFVPTLAQISERFARMRPLDVDEVEADGRSHEERGKDTLERGLERRTTMQTIMDGYDPFELDHLLTRTPRFPAEGGSSASTSSDDVSVRTQGVVVSPLNLARRSGREHQPLSVLPSPMLAPPIDLNLRMPLTRSYSNDSLMPPPPIGHLQPASPSGFPTTPSLSPFVPTPITSPSNVASGSKGPSSSLVNYNYTSLTHSPPSKPTFTLHRRRHPVEEGTARGKKNGSPVAGMIRATSVCSSEQEPIAPLDRHEAASGYFDRNPVVGPGKPLFLEPLAGLGFDMNEMEHRKKDLRRAATFTHTSSSQEDDLLDYYFIGSELEPNDASGGGDVLRRAQTRPNVPKRGFF